MTPDQRFLDILGNLITEHPKASGLYAPVLWHHRIAYVAGHLPKLDGRVVVTGKVGISVGIEKAQEAARLTKHKQAGEFGVGREGSGQRLAGLTMFSSDLPGIGLTSAQGLISSESFYWDRTDETRAWTKRFMAKRPRKIPNMLHAGIYSAVLHYLKAVQAVGGTDALAVNAYMRDFPVNDFSNEEVRIREDGRVMNPMYVLRVKAPSESRGPLDMDNAANVADFAENVVTNFRDVNVLINNAGIMRMETSIDKSRNLRDAEASITSNLLGPIRVINALVEQPGRQPDTAIINVSSGLAFVPLVIAPTYSAIRPPSTATRFRYARS